jgi:outer membrane protein
MKQFRRFSIALSLGLLAWGESQAQSLVDLFNAAKQYDATYQSATAQFEANRAKADQVIAGLFPSINLQTNATRTHADALGKGPQPNNFTFDRYYATPNMVLSMTQPLYRPQALLAYEQSKLIFAQAVQAMVVAEQDLLVRVSQAYFDVLASQDSLNFVLAQKTAVAEQLAAAKRNFEVGTATITDTREAEARFDLVKAQEIAARNDLSVKQLALDTVTGVNGAKPTPLAAKDALPRMLPQSLDELLNQAEAAHPGIRTAAMALDVAKLEIDRARAGHKPTVDLTVNQVNQYNYGGTSGNAATGSTYWLHTATLGVQMNLPLFAGFATQNRIRETLSLSDKAQQDLEATRRSVTQGTKSAYLNLSSGLGQVKALEAAEDSSQLALDANKLGYNVGVRINIDVLNSQSQLFQTKRDLAQARYNVLLGALKLRQANGTLKPEDLQSVNDLLK